MTTLAVMDAKAAELRQSFDRERAAPFPVGAEERSENLLTIRVSRDAYAIRVSEISGLVKDKKIVAFPTPMPNLLGVAGIRGVLVPVYRLSGLLGYGAETEQARWLALCGKEEPWALAFSRFEGYSRMPQAQLHLAEPKDVRSTFVTHVARMEDLVRAVVSIPLMRDAIQERCREIGVSKER